MTLFVPARVPHARPSGRPVGGVGGPAILKNGAKEINYSLAQVRAPRPFLNPKKHQQKPPRVRPALSRNFSYSLLCVRAAWGRAPKSLGGRPTIAAGTQLLALSFSGRPVGGGPPLTRELYSLPVIFGSPPPRSRKATWRRNLFSLAGGRQVARAGSLPS